MLHLDIIVFTLTKYKNKGYNDFEIASNALKPPMSDYIAGFAAGWQILTGGAAMDRPGYFITVERVVLDGVIPISPDEAKLLLRSTQGQLDSGGLRTSPPEVWRA